MKNLPLILEKERSTPVRKRVDVVVGGGGLGGVSAAISAARLGMKTLLVERNSFPGGVGTAGLCCSVNNSMFTGERKLMIKGNPLEFTGKLAETPNGPGASWRNHKGHVIYDVEQAKLALTELLEENGVEYLLETQVVDVIKENNTLKGILIESKSGREAILADAVIDATGDADLAVLSGAPYFKSTPEKTSASFVFRVGGVDVDAFVDYFVQNPSEYQEELDVDWTLKEALAQYKENGTFLFPHGGGYHLQVVQKGLERGEYPTAIGGHKKIDALQMHGIRSLGVVHMVTGFVDTSALDIGSLSREITNGRRMAFAVTDYFKKHIPGFANAYVAQTADDMGIRYSRWIDGEFVFTREMKNSPFRCKDSIGREVVVGGRKGEGMFAAPIMREDYCQIPLSCLIPKEIDGLIMGSGRSASTDAPILRGMVSTMLLGQGAGVAAAISVKSGVAIRNIDIDALQEALRAQGVEV